MPQLMNEYANGETQRKTEVDFSGHVWEFTEQLSAADLATLRTFYQDHDGPTIPFVFYELAETFPPFTIDPTGEALDGQFLARFDGAWDQNVAVGAIGTVNIRVVEVV